MFRTEWFPTDEEHKRKHFKQLWLLFYFKHISFALGIRSKLNKRSDLKVDLIISLHFPVLFEVFVICIVCIVPTCQFQSLSNQLISVLQL